MLKVLYTALGVLLYYFTALYKAGSKVVKRHSHQTTLKLLKVVPKVVKVVV